MANSPNEYLIPSIMKSPIDQVVDVLDMLMLIDIGTIKSVDPNGRAVVVSSKVIGDSIVVFEDVEVIGIGNNNGGFIVDGTGCACLILVPRTAMTDISNLKVDWSNPLFSKNGVKALPITNGTDLNVTTGISSEGTFYISGKDYTISFEDQKISYNRDGVVISLNDESKLQIYRRRSSSGIFTLSLDDNGINSTYTNSEKSSKYSLDINEDGICNISHVKPGDTDTLLNSFTINDDGSLELKVTDKADMTIDKDGNINIAINDKFSISVDNDGKITLSTSADINVTTDGKMDLTSKGDLTLKSSQGAVAIESTQQSVTIDSKTVGQKVSINGTNLQVNK